MAFDLKLLDALGAVIDRLVTVQIYLSGGGSAFAPAPITHLLYDAARKKFASPLISLAARALLEKLEPGARVMLVSGFIVPPWMVPEADGPIGIMALARALDLGFEVTPVVVMESAIIDRMIPLAGAVGLEPVRWPVGQGVPRKVVLEGFPIGAEGADKRADELLDFYQPKAIIAMEKPAANSLGVYHNGAGIDVTPIVGKLDRLIEKARQRGILTIGVGDGGNEIGMGCIEEDVRKIIPNAAHCGCPCGGGIAAATQTDHLIVASISNWGGYGLEACLGLALHAPEVLHSAAMEDRLLEAAGRAGFVCPASGTADGTVDGLTGVAGRHIVELLGIILDTRLKNTWRGDMFRRWSERRAETDALIQRWAVEHKRRSTET
jgi:hypothetical protein